MHAVERDDRRLCSRCGELKPPDAFPWKNQSRGVRRSYCWDCCRSYAREHYQRNRATYLERIHKRHLIDRDACRRLAYEYLESHGCVDCGETNLAVLDFDHRDRSTKRWSIASLIRLGNVALLVAEMAKCDVRCANDHRRRTAREFGYTRWLAQQS